ncbi:MAG: phosphate transport system regulatory protein PhoU [Flavobacteriaceae bacterium]|nr:MAG: phosphate transport system regulatory protein PhoU [Flavobacteriaceae bacterium]
MENANHQKELLNQAGLEMMSLCISQLEKATEAYLNNDVDLAEEVIYTEAHVNALDIYIEKNCERYMALYTPVATDLRFVIAILKINIDLERIGDHAYGISKYVVEDETKTPEHLIKVLQFEKMHATIRDMFEDIMDAFENENVKSARKVFKKDKILDAINSEAFSVIEAEIKKDTGIIGKALQLSSIIKKYERVGDLIKNIAEEIIFYKKAELIKHKGNKK